MIRLNDIIERVNQYKPLDEQELELIKKSYVFSAKVHAGQKRVSGEPYLSHPLEVSAILTRLRLDVPTISTGLLHDTVEDTLTTMEEIEELFGKEIAFLVDGTTKISKLEHSTKIENQAENIRKLMLATAKDIRVILIKLADRLHNMRTLEFLPEENRKRISNETFEIYAPLAHRLGINWLTNELEDLAFKYRNPQEYSRISQLVASKKKEWDKNLKKIKTILDEKLRQFGIHADVTGRFKHNYGIYYKMQSQNKDFDSVYDVLAFRIITDTESECYQALGVIHNLWKPIPGRIKDYIALPKANGYQSLHTTVLGPIGEQMEIQIRTAKMHEFAEYGIAAHWAYKEGEENGNKNQRIYTTLRQLFELKDIKDPTEFIEALKNELITDVVYVFTPGGDLIELPSGATPVDFAYSIHSEVGNTCNKALVNHSLVPLDYKLKNGDTVEIVTAKDRVPSRDWLKFVVTSKAKTRIRSWLRKEEQERSEQVGKSIFERKLKSKGMSLNEVLNRSDLDDHLAKLNLKSIKDFYRAVGFGSTSVNELLKLLEPEKATETEEKKSRIGKIINNIRYRKNEDGVVEVKGYNDIMTRFAKCCSPLPGEPIVGYITRGKGISIHRNDCPHLLEIDPERKIEVNWSSNFKGKMPAKIVVVCNDQTGMLSKLTNAISSTDVNIVKVEMNRVEVEKARGLFDLEVDSVKQLDNLINNLKGLKGVTSVERQTDQT